MKNFIYAALFIAGFVGMAFVNKAYAGTCSFTTMPILGHFTAHFVKYCGLTKDGTFIIYYLDGSAQTYPSKVYNIVFDPKGDEIVK